MTEQPKTVPGTRWRCKRCDRTETTPLPVKDVLCATCNKRLGIKQVWMQHDD